MFHPRIEASDLLHLEGKAVTTIIFGSAGKVTSRSPETARLTEKDTVSLVIYSKLFGSTSRVCITTT